jgi:hypothetical protein
MDEQQEVVHWNLCHKLEHFDGSPDAGTVAKAILDWVKDGGPKDIQHVRFEELENEYGVMRFTATVEYFG